jgi:hypothetical protein
MLVRDQLLRALASHSPLWSALVTHFCVLQNAEFGFLFLHASSRTRIWICLYLRAARPLIFCFCTCFCILCALVARFSISARVLAFHRSARSLASPFLHITAYFISAHSSFHAVADSKFSHTCCIVAISIYAEALPPNLYICIHSYISQFCRCTQSIFHKLESTVLV